MAKQKSRKGNGSYLEYKNENRYKKNKIKKLERHLKKYPHDKLAEEALENFKKSGEYKRERPRNPGINKVTGYLHFPAKARTPKQTIEERMSELFGIPIKSATVKKSNPKVRIKRKKNV